MPSITESIQLARNMGLRYILFRTGFEIEKRLGLFKKRFPQSPPRKQFISLLHWRRDVQFFGVTSTDKSESKTSKTPDLEKLLSGKFPFFSAQWIDLGKDYDWITNPDTGHQYSRTQHWSQVQDYSPAAGDIKFVWEKSRFAYLYEVIRNDQLHKEDHSEWVFNEINSWLKANFINSGPNYKCSQEVSLRVLNWTYALHYYKDSVHLTEELFQDILHAVYWQLKHVYSNINFSRIAVRNNHAITETLTLYLGSLFFPFFPEATNWKKHGKKWFEEEIVYQVYPDGTFLQFSMNYHRVVIQLFCWAFKSADFFGEKFSVIVYERAYKSLAFLYSCQDELSGWLPNYGSNDGALFFKFNTCDFRDYRPQLNALHVLLTGASLYGAGDWEEDVFWFQAKQLKGCNFQPLMHKNGWSEFSSGGYFILREGEMLTFVRCGKHKDRPAQADNLHLDIWYKGENILFDAGSYKYNTDLKTLKYFMGTESHNVVMLNNEDQMQKGPRFIWYHWSQAESVQVSESSIEYYFEGAIAAFGQIDPEIRQIRKIKKVKGEALWFVEDTICNKPKEIKMKQYWHALPGLLIRSEDDQKNPVALKEEPGWRSDYYGIKKEAVQLVAETQTNKIITRIALI